MAFLFKKKLDKDQRDLIFQKALEIEKKQHAKEITKFYIT
jgi:hypothetical protein